jgi:cation transport protein ChaC
MTGESSDLGESGDLWVFGYGSLMWDPGFAHVDVRPAKLWGWHRALCVLSILNRGTKERPGLALGLARGGSCAGRVFRVTAGKVSETLEYLRVRELATNVYDAMKLAVRLDDGQRLPALVFITRTDHPQYVSGLSVEAQARIVVQGQGCYGSSLDYVRNVVRHLDEIGIADGPLHRVLAAAEALACGEPGPKTQGAQEGRGSQW